MADRQRYYGNGLRCKGSIASVNCVNACEHILDGNVEKKWGSYWTTLFDSFELVAMF